MSASPQLLACAPAHLVTCKPCLGGEGAAHRYSAPARAHLATRKLCLAASPRRRDGAQLLLLVYAWRHRDIKQRRTCVHAHLTTCERCSDARRGGRAAYTTALVQHAQGATREARSRSHVCMRTWQRTGRARRMSQTRLHCGGGHPVRPEAACSACVHAHLAKCEPCSLVVAQLLRRMHT